MRMAPVSGPAFKGSCCGSCEELRVDERVGVGTAGTVILGALFQDQLGPLESMGYLQLTDVEAHVSV